MADLLEVKNLKRYFKTPTGDLHAVDGVNFTLKAGKTLGVVGESGCGKSTLGRVVLGLIEATEGTVLFEGKDITHLKTRKRREMCKEMQMIFQDPLASLNPRMCVEELIMVIGSEAEEVFGNAITSRMDCLSASSMTKRSRPSAMPP